MTTPAGQARTLDRFEQFPDEGMLPLAMEEVAIRLNPTQGLAGMDKQTRTGIRLRTLMDGRRALAPVLTDHHRRLERIRWAVYLVQRAFLSPSNVARRILAVRTGSWADMEAAIDQLGTTGTVEDLAGVRRIVRRRDGNSLGRRSSTSPPRTSGTRSIGRAFGRCGPGRPDPPTSPTSPSGKRCCTRSNRVDRVPPTADY